MTTRTLLPFAVLFLLPAVAAAAPPADPLVGALMAIDTVPDKAALERHVPDARARLLAIAEDDGATDYLRLRAMGTLSLFADDGVRAAFGRLAASANPEIRRRALYGLGRVFGQPGDAALVRQVAGGVRDKVADVRTLALRGLRWIDHPAAAAALADVQGSHPDAKLRELAAYVAARRTARLAKRPPATDGPLQRR